MNELAKLTCLAIARNAANFWPMRPRTLLPSDEYFESKMLPEVVAKVQALIKPR